MKLLRTGLVSLKSYQKRKFQRCAQPTTVIIAHRGASGMRPAHSVAGYELAADQGADYIECDLALTQDGVLVCLHDPFLSSVTDIDQLEDFADRKVSFHLGTNVQTFLF